MDLNSILTSTGGTAAGYGILIWCLISSVRMLFGLLTKSQEARITELKTAHDAQMHALNNRVGALEQALVSEQRYNRETVTALLKEAHVRESAGHQREEALRDLSDAIHRSLARVARHFPTPVPDDETAVMFPLPMRETVRAKT